MRQILAFLVAISILSAPSYAKNNVVSFEPTTRWTLDYAEDSCSLARTFSAGNEELILQIAQYQPGENYEVTVLGTSSIRGAPGKLRLGDSMEFELYGERGIKTETKRGFIATFDLRSDDEFEIEDRQARPIWQTEKKAVQVQDADFVELDMSGTRDIRIETGQISAPVVALSDCVDELVTHWGIDVVAHKSLSRRVVARDYKRMATNIQRDFPKSAMLNGRGGWIAVRIDVDEQGNGVGCHVQNDLNAEPFVTAMCENMTGERLYEPALDKDGNPIASYFATTVSYRTS